MAPLAFALGAQELLLLLLIVVILFGARRIPEIMKGVGEGVNSFKKGIRGDGDDSDKDDKDDKSGGSPSP